MDRKKQKREVNILLISTIITIVVAAGNIFVAMLSDSMTILLDGLFAAADTVISVVMIFVIYKLYEPPNKKYHFGYAKYEPLMVFVQGVMFATICSSAIVMSVQDIIGLEPIKHIQLVVIYSLISGTICIAFGAYMKVVARECSSPLVEADAELTIAEGLISFAAFAAFGVAQIMPKTSFLSKTEYVDPILCIIIALILFKKPLQIIYDSFRDLLDVSVPEEKQNEIMRLAHQCKEKHRLKDIGWFKVRKAGRRMFLTISFIADHNKPLHELERIRDGIAAEIVDAHPGADVCILFHAKKEGHF